MTMDELIKQAFARAAEPMKRKGKIAPFMLTDAGDVVTLGDARYDPTLPAKLAIRMHFPALLRCVVVTSGRVALENGNRRALMVTACEKGEPLGMFWMQTYRTGLRGFHPASTPELRAKSANVIDKALGCNPQNAVQILKYAF